MGALCVAKAGLMAGVIMGVIAMMLNMMKVTTLDLTQYIGCMLTGQKSGAVSMAAGLVIHLVMSVIFAFIYVWIAEYLAMPLTPMNGALFGLIHSILGGIMMPLMDNMNGCVSKGRVKAMNMFAQGHDTTGTITYFGIHILYGALLAMFL